MLKEKANIFRRLMICTDLCIVILSFFLGYFLRGNIKGISPLASYIVFLPVLIFLWGCLLYAFGMYYSFRTRTIGESVLIILQSFLAGFILFGMFLYIFKFHDISRLLIGFIFTITAGLIFIEKLLIILFFRFIRKRGLNYRSILVVGTGRRAQHFLSLVEQHREWGFKVVGLIDEDESMVSREICGCKVLGTFKDGPQIIREYVIDDVIFIVPRSWLNKIEELMHLCESEGLKVHVAVDYFNLKISRAKISEIHGFPLLSFESTSDRLWHLLVKRIIDIAISLTALLILCPVFVITAILIKLTSEGPVFFRQERCSLNGRIFRLYKFRTMVKGAEAKLSELLSHNEMNGPAFKMANDPRITPIGRLLRKFSIDELPQLWNVFKGNMSLVGPRPPLPQEVKKYDDWQRRRLSMRPGITCLWQTNGRNKITDFDQWMKMDLEYIDQWSLLLDCNILLKTVPVVLFGVGAK
jgi:exopolysaccharide biosynthesis polyprenyl glycosylphosphotransferase